MGIDVNKQELTDGEKLDFIIEQSLLKTRTIMIAECVSFNESRNTVSVQPLIQRKGIGESASSNLPIIQDVPVAYYGGGGVVITYKPAKGDTCELWINDRSIEQWKKKGGITDPQRARHHNFSDAVAYFGLNEYDNAYANLKGGIDVRTRDGNTSLHLVDQSVEVQIGNTPIMTLTSGSATFSVPVIAPSAQMDTTVTAQTVTAITSLTVADKEMNDHTHSGVTRGTKNTDPV